MSPLSLPDIQIGDRLNYTTSVPPDCGTVIELSIYGFRIDWDSGDACWIFTDEIPLLEPCPP